MEKEIVWVANFGLNGSRVLEARPPTVGTAVVVKRTNKKVIVEPTKATGYGIQFHASDCFTTREEVIAHIRPRCIQLAEMHEKIAAEFRAAVEGESK
jgi:hypothetical protein